MNMLSNEAGLYVRRALFTAASSLAALLAALHGAKAADWNSLRVMIVSKDVGITDGPSITVPCSDCDDVPFDDPYVDGDGRPVDPSNVPVTGTLRAGMRVKVLTTYREKKWNWCGPNADHICAYGPGLEGQSGWITSNWVFVAAIDANGNPLRDRKGKPIENWISPDLLSP
jgi:hypothetical protein